MVTMSKVYFVEAKDCIIENLEVLLEKAGVSNLTGVTAVKTHMGERKNKNISARSDKTDLESRSMH